MKVSPYCYCLLFDEKGTINNSLNVSLCVVGESRSDFCAPFDG